MEYNIRLAVRYVGQRVPVTVQYFYGIVEEVLHPDVMKYAPLEIRDGYVEPNIKNGFDFAEGDFFHFSGIFSGNFGMPLVLARQYLYIIIYMKK